MKSGDSDFLRNLLIAATVFFALVYLGNRFLPAPAPRPTPPAGAPTPDDQTGPARAAQPPAGLDDGASGMPGASQPAQRGTEQAAFTVEEGSDRDESVVLGPREPIIVEGFDAAAIPFRARVVVSNVGASVERVTLTDHREQLGAPGRYELIQEVQTADGARVRPLAIEKVNVNGVDLELADRRWSIVRREEADGSHVAECTIEIVAMDGAPALRLVRTLTLPPQSVVQKRHDLYTNLRTENLSPTPLSVVIAYRGGVGIRQANTFRDDRVIDVGVRSGERVLGARKVQSSAARSTDEDTLLYRTAGAQGAEQVAWVSTCNSYFTCLLAPTARSGQREAGNVSVVEAFAVPTPTEPGAGVRLVTRPETIAPGEDRSYPVEVYIGPLEASAFKTVEPYRSRNYYYQIEQNVPWCTFAVLVELMVWLLDAVYAVWPHNYGLAIIVLVLIVRALLHPITKAGQLNMVRMQQKMGEFQPKVEELKRKFGNDKTRLQQEQMKLYRQEGINPAGQVLTCLPMFIQMPIWVALYVSLSNNIAMRHQPFLLWIRDLTAPDALVSFSPIHLPLMGAIDSFNLLPLLLAVAMYFQQKLMPKPKPNPNMTDQQRQQQEMMQKMMPIMSIMMLFIFYKAPSGLTLYVLASTAAGTYEQYRIRKHIREREAAGTLHRAARPNPTDGRGPRILSWFGRLQQMAESAQKQQGKRRKPH
jgi:YidC/Oxa1 family membrane protein insertase